jgi:trimeric autotransporter adhesin
MRSRSLFTSFLSMALAALLLAGCANQMEPATRAIADIEAAIGAAGADAAQFIPDELQAVTGGLADLKAKFDQKDYKGVMAAAPALLAQAQALAGSAATARAAAEAAQAAALEAMNAEWTTLSGTLPAAVAAIESRVNVLSKSKKLPAGLDAATFDSVKTGLADAKSLWDQATAAQAAGNVEAAVTAARQVKDKADAALAALGMTAG